MKKLYTPTTGGDSWRELLADPEMHWKRGASAMELAISWESAARSRRALPASVERVLDMHEATRNSRLLFGFPEHRVAIAGGTRPSQTDLWAVLKTEHAWVSVAVEGKAREPFGPTINEWLRDASEGKQIRLRALCETLGVPPAEASELRYQLFHRTASAILEASRIGARTAVLLVQNFYPDSEAWHDFRQFAALFNVEACRNGLCTVKCPGVEVLLFAWVDSPVATDTEFAALVSQPLPG